LKEEAFASEVCGLD